MHSNAFNSIQRWGPPPRRNQMALLALYGCIAIIWAASRILFDIRIGQLQFFVALQSASIVVSLIIEFSKDRPHPAPIQWIANTLRVVGGHGHTHSHSHSHSHEGDCGECDHADHTPTLLLHVPGVCDSPRTDRLHILIRVGGYIFVVFGALTTIVESIEHGVFDPAHNHPPAAPPTAGAYLEEGLLIVVWMVQSAANLYVTFIIRPHSKYQPLGLGEWTIPTIEKPTPHPTMARSLWVAIEPIVPTQHKQLVQGLVARYAACLLCDVLAPLLTLVWWWSSSSTAVGLGPSTRATIIISVFWMWMGINQLLVDGAILSNASPIADPLKGLLLHAQMGDGEQQGGGEEGVGDRCRTRPTSVLCASAGGHSLGDGVEVVESLLWIQTIGELCGVFHVRNTLLQDGATDEDNAEWNRKVLSKLGDHWGPICASIVVQIVK